MRNGSEAKARDSDGYICQIVSDINGFVFSSIIRKRVIIQQDGYVCVIPNGNQDDDDGALQPNPIGELDSISLDEKRRSADVRVSSRAETSTTDGTPDEVHLLVGWIKETLNECRESYSRIATNPSDENAL